MLTQFLFINVRRNSLASPLYRTYLNYVKY